MSRFLDDEIILPHIPLSAEDKSAALEVMRVGNPLFRFWAHEFFGMENQGRRFRKEFFQGALGNESGSCPLIPAADVKAMMAVRAVEERMLFGHTKLVRKVAMRRYEAAKNRTYLSEGDVILECAMSLRESIYSWMSAPEKSSAFITYAWSALDRQARRTLDDSRPLSGIGSKSEELGARFAAAQETFNGPASIDDILEVAEFTVEERVELRALQVRSYATSTSASPGDEGWGSRGGGSVSYLEQIALSREVQPLDDVIAREDIEIRIRQSVDIIFAAGLSLVELGFYFAKEIHGSQSALARRSKNAKGDPLTRAGGGVIVHRATGKVEVVRQKLGIACQIMRTADVLNEVVERRVQASMMNAVASMTSSEPFATEFFIVEQPSQGYTQFFGTEVVVVEVVEAVEAAKAAKVVEAVEAAKAAKRGANVPKTLLASIVDRLVAGESRRKLVAEIKALGYHISVSPLYYLGVKRKKELAAAKKVRLVEAA